MNTNPEQPPAPTGDLLPKSLTWHEYWDGPKKKGHYLIVIQNPDLTIQIVPAWYNPTTKAWYVNATLFARGKSPLLPVFKTAISSGGRITHWTPAVEMNQKVRPDTPAPEDKKPEAETKVKWLTELKTPYRAEWAFCGASSTEAEGKAEIQGWKQHLAHQGSGYQVRLVKETVTKEVVG
jgi:hypothetical protein